MIVTTKVIPITPHRARPLAALTLPALVLLLGACGGGPKTEFDADRAFDHVQTMVGFGPRPSGSEAMKEQAEWLHSELTNIGLEAEIQAFTEDTFGRSHKFEGAALEFRNVHAVLPGTHPDDGPYILVCAHYDSKLMHGHDNQEHNFEFVGAIDGAGASAVNLELARVFTARYDEMRGREGVKLPNLWFVWFDGEENFHFDWNQENDHDALFGSRHFVEYLKKQGLANRCAAMILPDLIGDKDIKIDRDLASSTWLQDLFLEAARDIGEEERMYKYKSAFTDDHIPFRDIGIARVALLDFEYRRPASRKDGEPAEIAKLQAWWHTPNDTIDKMSVQALQFAGDLLFTGLVKLEQHERVLKRFR